MFHTLRAANNFSRNFFRNFLRQQFKPQNLFSNKAFQFSLLSLAGSLALSTISYRAETKEVENGKPKVPQIVEDLRDIKMIERLDLYQYEACPFCNKLRAYLDFHRVPYTVHEVNPLSKSEIRFSSYKKVPLLVVNGEYQLVDSSKIIKALSDHFNYKDFTEEGVSKWTEWVDTYFIHLLAPNIYRTMSEAYEAFGYITETGNFSYLTYPSRVTGASIMYFISKRLKKKHNITDERKSLYEGVDYWLAALAEKQFMGGDQPNLSDLYMYGVLRSIEGLSTFNDMVANTKISEWYQRIKKIVGPSVRTNNKPPSILDLD